MGRDEDVSLGGIRRLLAGASVLLVMILSMQLTGRAAQVRVLTVTPEQGPSGIDVVVDGSGFLPVLEVTICWDESTCNEPLAETVTDAFGSFTVTVTIPETDPDRPHRIHACQIEDPVLGDLLCAIAPFDVTEEPPTTTTTTAPDPTTTTTTTTLTPDTTTTVPRSTTTTVRDSITSTSSTTTTTTLSTNTSTSSTTTTTTTLNSTTTTTSAQGNGGAPTTSTTNSSGPTLVYPSPKPPTDILGVSITPTSPPYTPPTVSETETRETDSELPILWVAPREASPAATQGSWLENRSVFWVFWIAAVIVGGLAAEGIAGIIRRRRNEEASSEM